MAIALVLDVKRDRTFQVKLVGMLSRDDDICQEIISIASAFGIFDCVSCARAIKEFLVACRIYTHRFWKQEENLR